MNDHTNGAPGGATPRHRHKTRAEERIEALDTSAATLAAQLEELRVRAELAEQESAENKAGWQRSAADFANYRRRTEQQRDEELGLANESLLLKLLAIVDDFDRAVAHAPAELRGSAWVDGIVAIDRKLDGLLASEGVTPIEVEGKPFDPRDSEAILHEETADAPDGTVLRELVRGYRIRDRVLRPALVAVAKNDTTGGAAPAAPEHEPRTTAEDGARPAPDSRE
jgi:molecular chaperone GrpE